MNKINEIGNTKKGQEMLGRTAERAYQRAQRTSGADKKRYMRTYNDAYKTGGKSSNKHLGGSREHFDNGRDYEYEKWADEHNGNVAETKTMNKKLIRLTESDLHKIVKESVNRILKESMQPNHEEIWNKIQNAWNEALKWSRSWGFNSAMRDFADNLAWIMVDNNMTIDDLKEYGNVLDKVDYNYLNNQLEQCRKYMAWEKADDKRREAEAWAEEQMSDMGFGYEGD